MADGVIGSGPQICFYDSPNQYLFVSIVPENAVYPTDKAINPQKILDDNPSLIAVFQVEKDTNGRIKRLINRKLIGHYPDSFKVKPELFYYTNFYTTYDTKNKNIYVSYASGKYVYRYNYEGNLIETLYFPEKNRGLDFPPAIDSIAGNPRRFQVYTQNIRSIFRQYPYAYRLFISRDAQYLYRLYNRLALS